MRVGALVSRRLRMGGAMMVAALTVGLPVALLGAVDVSVHAGTILVQRATQEHARVATVDGRGFLSDDEARRACAQAGNACRGVLRIAERTDEKDPHSSRFALIGPRDLAERVFHPPDLTGRDLEPLMLAWPWQAVADHADGPVAGAWAVLDHGAQVPSMSARDSMWNLPHQLFFGPSGTGSSEVIPLLSYTLFGGMLFLFVVAMVQGLHVRTELAPLRIQGASRGWAWRSTAAALLIPVLAATLVTVLGCVAYWIAILGRHTGTYLLNWRYLGLPTGAVFACAGLLMTLLALLALRLTGNTSLVDDDGAVTD